MAKRRRVIPGFGLAMGYTLFCLSLLVLIPLAALCAKAGQLSWGTFWGTVRDPYVVSAYRVSFQASLAAAVLNAFFGVVFPELYPAWLSGLALAFARSIGEYGSVIFVASNKHGESQIAPLQIMEKLDEFEYAKATAVGVVLLAVSLAVLLLINGL